MKKIMSLALILVGFSFVVSGQELMFDGTVKDHKTAVIKPEVKAVFESQVFPIARKYFKAEAQEETGCEEKFEINDGAAMQISTEKVYLYTYCGFPESSRSYQGVVVITSGKVSKHLVFKTLTQQYFNIFYKNGLIVLSGSGTKMQSDWGTVTTIDLGDTTTQRSFWSYSNSCNLEGEKCVETARKIYLGFIDGYWFSAEEFKKRAGKWVKTKAKKDVTVDNDEEQLRLEDLKELK